MAFPDAPIKCRRPTTPSSDFESFVHCDEWPFKIFGHDPFPFAQQRVPVCPSTQQEELSLTAWPLANSPRRPGRHIWSPYSENSTRFSPTGPVIGFVFKTKPIKSRTESKEWCITSSAYKSISSTSMQIILINLRDWFSNLSSRLFISTHTFSRRQKCWLVLTIHHYYVDSRLKVVYF